MKLDRQKGESALQHHKRLVYGKLVDKTLADADYTELAPYVYGQDYSADVARRMMYGSCRTLQLLDAEAENEAPVMDDIELRRIELQKEQQRFYDQRRAFNKIVTERARQEELNSIIERAIQNSCAPLTPLLESERESECWGDGSLLVTLADIHYGMVAHNAWNNYDSEECCNMMTRYLDRILDIQKTHRCSKCYVLCLGDVISGCIHKSIQLDNRENVVEQVMGASELIARFMAALASAFDEVYFISVAGNHSRLAEKKDATRDERLDDLIGFYLKARLANYPNVYVEDQAGDKIDATIACVNIEGKDYALVHGDMDSIPHGVQTLQTMVGHPIYGVVCGHKHHSYFEYVDGIRVVMAGSFVSMDDFAISKRLYSEPEQTVCVCDGSGIRCMYNVPLR